MTATGVEPNRRDKIRDLARAIAQEEDCDVILFNYGLDPMVDDYFYSLLARRVTKRPKLLMLLTTEGGLANVAYRIARWLQDMYPAGITILVAGWCKSAGTLLCIAAKRLLIADTGELGPLDVQIAKADEMWERSSGLVVEAAFEKLQQESFKLFFQHLSDIKERAGRITFKTAAEVAAQLVVGQTHEIFAKIDPHSVGEDHRSNLIAEQYAIRLDLRAQNLVQTPSLDGLEMLLRGYPSHTFVIDRMEAANLFKEVAAPSGKVAELAQILGNDVIVPRNALRKEQPRLEYLNAEDTQATAKQGKTARKRSRRRGTGKTDGQTEAPDLRGRVPLRSESKGGEREAA